MGNCCARGTARSAESENLPLASTRLALRKAILAICERDEDDRYAYSADLEAKQQTQHKDGIVLGIHFTAFEELLCSNLLSGTKELASSTPTKSLLLQLWPVLQTTAGITMNKDGGFSFGTDLNAPLTMEWVVRTIVKPATAEEQCALLECFFGVTFQSDNFTQGKVQPLVGPATHFFSYTWQVGTPCPFLKVDHQPQNPSSFSCLALPDLIITGAAISHIWQRQHLLSGPDRCVHLVGHFLPEPTQGWRCAGDILPGDDASVHTGIFRAHSREDEGLQANLVSLRGVFRVSGVVNKKEQSMLDESFLTNHSTMPSLTFPNLLLKDYFWEDICDADWKRL